jgi:hypothetical protein
LQLTIVSRPTCPPGRSLAIARHMT